MPELTHGLAVQIAPGLRRITAPNPGFMTGAGTNTYLLGEREVAVVDPGPDIPEHVAAINAAITARGGTLARIFATHTHIDHSPAAGSLMVNGVVECIGALASDSQFQDAAFQPDIVCEDGQLFDTTEYRLRAIATPGHVDNHFCFLEENSGVLMTGDHMMNGATVVIIPPSGDMAAYLRSLERLLSYPLQLLAPGHGDVMEQPFDEIRRLLRHRRMREAKVVRALTATGQSSLDVLVVVVYDDVDAALHVVAKYSLEAHLIKLVAEGRARSDGELWIAIE